VYPSGPIQKSEGAAFGVRDADIPAGGRGWSVAHYEPQALHSSLTLNGRFDQRVEQRPGHFGSVLASGGALLVGEYSGQGYVFDSTSQGPE